MWCGVGICFCYFGILVIYGCKNEKGLYWVGFFCVCGVEICVYVMVCLERWWLLLLWLFRFLVMYISVWGGVLVRFMVWVWMVDMDWLDYDFCCGVRFIFGWLFGFMVLVVIVLFCLVGCCWIGGICWVL